MALNHIRWLGPLKQIVLAGWHWDARNKYKRFEKVLTKGASIVDVGSGYGTVTDVLRQEGFQTTPVDIAYQAIRTDLQPIVYNGQKLPFDDQQFDFGLLLTVLHHTPKPEQVLAETARVSQKLIVIEDVYRNRLQQYLTYFADSFFNFEFKGHPHTNKTRQGWQEACASLGLSLKVIRSDRFLLFFRQETYLITSLEV